MDIRHLRYAVAIAETGTFTAAARRCFVAQPSLSQSIKRLEREVGVELFSRTGRAAVPTAAGEAFVAEARHTLRSFDRISAEVGAVAGLTAGHLDLVALPTLAIDPLASLVGGFRRRYPGVTVRLAHPEGTEDLLRAVRDGDSEIGVTETPAQAEGLAVVPLGRQEIVVAFPPGTARREVLRAEDLAEYPIIAMPIGTSMRALLDQMLDAAGIRAAIAVETDQRELIMPLVQGGAGVALVPRPVAEQARATGVEIHRLRPARWRDLAVVRRTGTPSPAARAFLAQLGP